MPSALVAAALAVVGVCGWVLLRHEEFSRSRSIMAGLVLLTAPPLLLLRAREGFRAAVTLGQDGMALRNSRGTRRIAYGKIRAIHVRIERHYLIARTVSIDLEDGSTVVLDHPFEHFDELIEELARLSGRAAKVHAPD